MLENLKIGNSLDYIGFKRKLLYHGYVNTSYVSMKGEFAIRGAIIDVYPYKYRMSKSSNLEIFGSLYPIRIVLDDEKIASIKIFNPVTQRTLQEVEEVEIELSAKSKMQSAELSLCNQWEVKSGQNNTLIIDDEQLIGRTKSAVPTNVYRASDIDLQLPSFNSQLIEDFLYIEEDDYVVHINYGIGMFKGFVKSKVKDKESEFIVIEYKDGVKVYVPVTEVNLLYRYYSDTRIGFGEIELSDIRRKGWKKLQLDLTKSMSGFAMNLLLQEASRKKLKGYEYIRNEQLEREFDREFRFTETDDQVKTIQILRDKLSDGEIIDAVICGDSGFGKTEVAARVAFRVVLNDKQVAILCPTTLLVEQHFMTFKERFKNFPVTIEKVSRLDSASHRKNIFEKVSKGQVDIIIGTTSLVKSRCEFSALGLLIVDEEHKFGVEDKEKLKFLNKGISVIYLSATPIPRTMHMALQGIKDISYIKTAPKNRIGTRTKVIEFDRKYLIDVINFELNRGGQVFFVTDKIKNLPMLKKFLEENFANTPIGMAYGQTRQSVLPLSNRELEDIFLKFYFGEYKILLSTNIVESGLDIVTANTIIIHNAQNFGLADLHQLRGRVGRSDIEGYAYLVVTSPAQLSHYAYRRLKILEEYSFLGSGFSISMFDMKFRGTGNILGKQQHGFVRKVGAELYSHLLNITIRKMQNKKLANQLSQQTSVGAINSILSIFEPAIELPFYYYIDASLLPDERMRFYYYKKFSDAVTLQEIQKLKEELTDFCGKLNTEAEEYINYHRLKILCKDKGVYKIERDDEDIVIKSFKRKDIILPFKDFSEPSLLYKFIERNVWE